MLDAGADLRDVQIAAGVLIRVPPCGTAEPAKTSTGTRTASSPPTWPPAHEAACLMLCAGDARHRAAALPIASSAYSIGCTASLYAVEIEPEVRSWLEKLTDRDFGRADFLVGLLAEHARGSQRAIRASPRREGTGAALPPAAPADPCHLLAGTRPPGDPADGIPQDPQRRDRGGGPCLTSPEDLRSRARPGPPGLRPGGDLT